MDLTTILSPTGAARIDRTLKMLRRHRIEALVLTGGLAVELHCMRSGAPAQARPLNDIDFLVGSFDEIPPTLSADLLFRHVHPHDPPGKTLLQCIDPETAVRVDIFRAYAGTISRAIPFALCGATFRIISLEDLTARAARLCMDLATGTRTLAKHPRDFLRLLPHVNVDEIEVAWREHRKPNHPESFAEAAELLKDLIAERKDLQTVPVYSQDVRAVCSRCMGTETFPLADPSSILTLLGYC